ncbi:Transmembrane protein [Quillaja saponaria]|uniref:Transmembrane protein n=1 Tax=Quillaja saponaria TaxID=32244 RepID=A0AAD7KPF5_QUISA|nr:Transmembrane protein [Quillaja saponaria]
MKSKGMDIENKHVMQKQKLEVIDILKEAVQIYFRNINFIIFTFLISLPLLCFLIYFETYLQGTLAEFIEILYQLPVKPAYRLFIPENITQRLSKDFSLKLIRLGFLYLAPLHVIELGTVIVSVNLASKVRSEERKLTLKEMFRNPFDIFKFKGTFITSIYVILLPSCTLLVLIWIVISYCMILWDSSFYILFRVICGVGLGQLLKVYLVGTAVWNMSILISILEGVHGFKALALAEHFSRGSQQQGFLLMFIFLVWGVCLRLPCLYVGCYKEGYGIVLQTGLFCIGNLLKWVVCMVYFYGCRRNHQLLENKIEEGIS